jgi:hypothetical protein
MATTKATQDDAAAAAAGVAVPKLTVEDYNKAVADAQAKISARPGASDARDLNIGWTAQSGRAYEDPESVPGQRFAPWQLPDPAIAVAQGHAPVVIPEHLITEDEDDPQGPEPLALGKTMYEVSEAVAQRNLAAYQEEQKTIDDRIAENAALTDSSSTSSKSSSTSTKSSS